MNIKNFRFINKRLLALLLAYIFMVLPINSKAEKKQINSDSNIYVYVIKVSSNGKITVSSWGRKYSFDNSQASWTTKVLLKKSE